MNNPIGIFQGPNAPDPIPQNASYGQLANSLRGLQMWAANLTNSLNIYLTTVRTQLNSATQGVGANINSASSIAVSFPIHHITGTATINTITPPAGFSGPIWLIADGAFSVGATGNIALAAGPFTQKQSVELVYDPNTALWYPNIG